ncbi:ATP phosphoribosyltransferase regulatory subunit [Nitrosococcus wardiae]|uniref:ATP phosphoribosyltransferase regulatory subunit n=1 Tax=Nitrosococcus wardiae TaxID=1814290 RepID=A0A4P7BYT7_9GAMM|nr:ATP phosphoribosyltransferase regulatory subunit [Nitrosococcus wardiae]QBQ53596.1 ATP phosphoribosyltransferase regulatory subunit [Nitrosococcus wardiae]
MPITERWLLPEGVGELLPAEAEQLECARRVLIDLFHSWGYELVVPPLIEYLESLLTGVGTDLELQTFKLTDQLTGRLMGVRADITPQVARIAAHRIKRKGIIRLCYIGSVLHTLPQGLGGARNPIQVGAELYGHGGIESDLEVLRLALEALESVGIKQAHLDLGHVGIFRDLVSQAGLSSEEEYILFDALQRKAQDEMDLILQNNGVSSKLRHMFTALTNLNGGSEVLAEAEQVLTGSGVEHALMTLKKVAVLADKYLPQVPIHFDLGELRGYRYHTGLVFAVYIPGRGQAVAQGGRYDDIGKVFGRAQPATGFSIDLKELVTLSSHTSASCRGIYAPWSEDPAFEQEVARLRQQGEQVVYGFPGIANDFEELDCNRELVLEKGQWQVTEIRKRRRG